MRKPTLADHEREHSKLLKRLCTPGSTPPELDPSIEDQAAQLKAAGWKRVRGHLWKAPGFGGYYHGPHGAWLAMQRRLDGK